MINEIYEKNFTEKVLKTDNLCIVDFYADWCGPCKMLSPLLDKLSGEYSNVNFYKVNVDDNRSLALHYNVASIPFLALFKNGELIDSSVGYRSENELKELIDKNR